LNETNTPHKVTKVDLKAHKTADGTDYYTINSKGAVPAIRLENGEVLTEGPAVSQYIADKAGATDLLPPIGDVARYRVVEAFSFAADVHHAYGPLFANPPEEAAKKYKEKLNKLYTHAEQLLSKHEYLAGNKFSVADAYFFAVSQWHGFVKVDLSGFKKVNEYLEKVKARPAVQKAFAEN